MEFTTKTLAVVASLVTAGVCLMPPSWAQTQKSPKEIRTADSQSAPKLQPLNIKPGLWESTRALKRTGALPIPSEMLNRLTPEQRARMEERIRANSGTHANTKTEQHCVTKEDLEKHRMTLADSKECTTTLLNSTSTTVKAKFVCDENGIQASGTLELVAADPEHLNGSYRSTANAQGNTMNVEGTWTSRWLGSSCGKTK